MEQPESVKPEDTNIPEHWLANYVPMWLGQVISVLGSALVQFALVWYLTEKTGSATILATATLVSLIPEVFLGPFSGAIVDRLNRKTIMIVSDLLVALATLALVLLFAFNQIQIWHIYVILFIRGTVGTFQYPAMSASISLMVPKEHLTRLAGIQPGDKRSDPDCRASSGRVTSCQSSNARHPGGRFGDSRIGNFLIACFCEGAPAQGQPGTRTDQPAPDFAGCC